MTEVGLGNWTEVKPVTLEVMKICIEVKKLIEEKIKHKHDSKTYIPVVFSSQIVNGTNYVVKVLVDEHEDGVCVHVKIHQALPCNGGKLTVTGIQFPKPFDDPLKPF